MATNSDEAKGATSRFFESIGESASLQNPLSRIIRHGDGKKRHGSQYYTLQTRSVGTEGDEASSHVQMAEYRTYKRRWFGLLQLILMNIIVSWDVSPTKYFPARL